MWNSLNVCGRNLLNGMKTLFIRIRRQVASCGILAGMKQDCFVLFGLFNLLYMDGM